MIDRLNKIINELAAISKEIQLRENTEQLHLKYSVGQKVYVLAKRKHKYGLVDSEKDTLESILEEVAITGILLEQNFDKDKPVRVRYEVNRFYEYQKNFHEEDLWATRDEAEKELASLFEQQMQKFLADKERQRLNRIEKLKKELSEYDT